MIGGANQASQPSVMGVLDVIAAAKDGAGASLGAMLASMQSPGFSFQQFSRLIQSLSRSGVVRIENDPVRDVPATAHLTELGQGVLRLLSQQQTSSCKKDVAPPKLS